MADVAGDLDRHRPARPPHAVVGIGLGPFGEHEGHCRERQHVVDDRRPPEQPDVRRQRRLGPDDPALALEAVEERGLLAADVGPRAHPYLEPERPSRAADVAAEPSGVLGQRDRRLERPDRMGILRAAVDVAPRRAHRDAGDGHALDEHEGIALHDHAVGEGAAVALVGVADDVLLRPGSVGHRLPLDPGREAGAAAAAQPRGRHLGDDRLRPDLQGPARADPSAMRRIVGERQRVGDARPREGQPRLPREEGDRLDRADRLRMRDLRGRRPRRERRGERLGPAGIERPEAPADAVLLDLDQRLQPEQPARRGPHRLDPGRGQRPDDVLRAAGDGGRRRAERRPASPARLRDQRVEPAARRAAPPAARRASPTGSSRRARDNRPPLGSRRRHSSRHRGCRAPPRRGRPAPRSPSTGRPRPGTSSAPGGRPEPRGSRGRRWRRRRPRPATGSAPSRSPAGLRAGRGRRSPAPRGGSAATAPRGAHGARRSRGSRPRSTRPSAPIRKTSLSVGSPRHGAPSAIPRRRARRREGNPPHPTGPATRSRAMPDGNLVPGDRLVPLILKTGGRARSAANT